MAKIRMLKTIPGSQDGRIVQKFKAGVEYEIGLEINQELADIFLSNKGGLEDVAILVDEPIKPVEVEKVEIGDVIIEPVKVEKKMEKKPENKMESGTDEDKDEKKKKKEKLKSREKLGFGRKR
jgi:hypothetical protein